MLKILDVGCGERLYSLATHSCDIALETEEQFQNGTVSKVDSSKNFILASVESLPYRSKVFDKVHCSNVIEHIENPWKAIRELERVTKLFLIIKVPHRFSRYAKAPFHKHYFNKTFFSRLGFEVKMTYMVFKLWKFALLGLALPNEVIAVKRFSRDF